MQPAFYIAVIILCALAIGYVLVGSWVEVLANRELELMREAEEKARRDSGDD